MEAAWLAHDADGAVLLVTLGQEAFGRQVAEAAEFEQEVSLEGAGGVKGVGVRAARWFGHDFIHDAETVGVVGAVGVR